MILKHTLATTCISLLVTLSAVAQTTEKSLQTKCITVADGETITIEAGTFNFSKSISLESKKNIIIKGAGMDKTIISFKGQTSGAEGFKISNATNITLQDITIQDAKGDAVKTMNIDGISFINVKTEWTGKPKASNGAYGLYPVSCKNVLIDGCVAIGASDAGIYVGQSQNIIVRNCKAIHNVAGIEIENSLYADVYNNESYDNTGGVLVFDLPDLKQKKGGYVRVYNNKILHNNFDNFAPKGNIVAKVAKGTGVLVLATSNVEIFNNEIINNNSMTVGIISYYMTENPIKDKEYNPYPNSIFIHDNNFERENIRPIAKGRLGQIYKFKLRFGKDVPHILYDGIINPTTKNADGSIKTEQRICIKNNKNESFVN
ncbi:MAG: parallel beta-helix domain-containing protein, partial [Bacteroidia bacterium]